MASSIPFYASKKEVLENRDLIKKDLGGKAQWFIKENHLYEWMKMVSKDAKIFDIGCGSGCLSKKLLECGFTDINLVDIDNYLVFPEVGNIEYSKPFLKFLRFKRPLPNTEFFKKYFSANICYILKRT